MTLSGALRWTQRASAVLLLAVCALPFPTLSELHGQQLGTLSGVIVDAGSATPVADVLVRIDGFALQAVSDSAGRFRISAVPSGSHRLVLRHVAYGEHSRTLAIGDSTDAEVLIRISQRAIELAPLEVEIRSQAERPLIESVNLVDVVERPTIEAFARRGATLSNLLASEIPGIRVNGPCVEFRLQAMARGIGPPADGDRVNLSCRELAVYIDGARIAMTSAELQTMPLWDLERVEVLSPSEAGVRFGLSGGRGVLLLRTQRPMPEEAAEPIPSINGLQWLDPRPYPWARVIGASLAGVSLNLGLAYAGLNTCVERDPGEFSPTACGPMIAAAAGMVTGTVTGLLTTWAGTTTLTRGRSSPALAAGVLSAVTGYLLIRNGENHESGASRTAGLTVLTVGTPLLLTLSDRIFRQLR